MRKSEQPKFSKFQPWFIWSLAAGFFFVEYFARVNPSVIVPQLMKAFTVGAFAVSSLAAFFYYPYSFMQLPVGVLMDRYGPHRLLTGAAILCAGGAFLFATASNLMVAEVGRVVIGFGASFAFVGALKIATIWFAPERFGFLAGTTQAMGMLGAAVGEGLFAWVVEQIGWRDTMNLIAAMLLILAVLIGIFVRDRCPIRHPIPENHEHINIWQALKIVFRNGCSWVNALYAGFLYAPTIIFGALWGPSFLHRAYGASSETAALMVSAIFIGWTVGSPALGWISDKVKRRRPIMLASAFFSLVFISVVLYVPNIPEGLLFVLLFLYGFSNMGVALSYAVASEINPLKVSGTSIAFANMASVLIGSLLQPVVGALIEWGWDGARINGMPYYSPHTYRLAMSMLPVSLLIAFILVFFIKETFCSRS